MAYSLQTTLNTSSDLLKWSFSPFISHFALGPFSLPIYAQNVVVAIFYVGARFQFYCRLSHLNSNPLVSTKWYRWNIFSYILPQSHHHHHIIAVMCCYVWLLLNFIGCLAVMNLCIEYLPTTIEKTKKNNTKLNTFHNHQIRSIPKTVAKWVKTE